MKAIVIPAGLLAGLLSLQTVADNVTNTEPSIGNIHLDASQNIFFDNFNDNTFSLQVLQAKNKFKNHDLIIGGSLEMDLQHWNGDAIDEVPPAPNYKEGNGFYFTQGTLDFMGNFTPWLTTFLSVAESHIAYGGPDGHYIYLPNAFLLLGNLEQFPFYTTFGISTIAFGVFSNAGPWDTSLASLYFNPAQSPQISVGFYKNGWNLAATAFSDQMSRHNNFAYSVYYNKDFDNWGYNAGIGYLTDMLSDNTSNAVVHKNKRSTVPALNVGDYGALMDINAGIRYKQLALNGEYVRGANQLFNNGKPAAYSIILTYTKNIWGKDTTFGIDRSMSFHLNAISAALTGQDGLPMTFYGLKSAWAVNISRSIMTDNVVLAFDIQRAMTYPGIANEKYTYTSTFDLVTYL